MQNALKHRVNAARAAVQEQVDFFVSQFANVSSEWKSDESRVTFADFAISEKVTASLRRTFPEDDFCSEESNNPGEVQELDARYAWVLDPIDGTDNYALGMPMAAISLALLKDGMPLYGFLYDYGARLLYEGGPGLGLFVGRQRVKSEKIDRPITSRSVIGMHLPFKEDIARRLAPIFYGCRARSLGSGALMLAYTSMGKLDGCLDMKVKVWDIAASAALAGACGVRMEYIEKSPFPLKKFHTDMEICPYYAGSEAFCEHISGLLELPAPVQ